MKKNLAIIALLGAALTSTTVFADLDPKFYIGGEAQYSKYKVDQEVKNALRNATLNRRDPLRKEKAAGGGLFFGSRFCENFGVEAGISRSGAIKADWQANNAALNASSKGSVRLKNTNIYADVMGYLPVADCVDLIGSLGLGNLHTSVSRNTYTLNDTTAINSKLNKAFNRKSSKVGGRIGAGIQYKFDENVGARLMLRHQQGNKIVKSDTQAGLGLFYQF